MQTTTQAYKTLLASGLHRKEIQVGIGVSTLPDVYILDNNGEFVLDNNSLPIGDDYVSANEFNYAEDKIFYVRTSGGLFAGNTLSFGGCVSREIEMRFYPRGAVIPRMARLSPRVRLTDGTTDSEWLPKGIFYVDTRDYDASSGILTLTGYDAMLKAEETYIQEGDVGTWPKTMPAVVAEIAARMGVEVDSRTRLNNYDVQLPTEYTMREVLGFIAAAHAGNWVITDEGKLRLIRIDDTTDTCDVGNAALRVTADDPFAEITHVIINLDEEVYVEAGNDTGRTIEVTCPWATQAMANAVLASLAGYHYQPFDADGALVDPAAEIGDTVTVRGTTGTLAKQSISFDSLFASDISAPAENEIDHEYPYQSPTQKEIRRGNRRIKTIETSFRVLAEEISGEITAIDGRVTTVSQKVDSIRLSVTNGAESSTIKLTVNGTEVSSQNITFSGMVTFQKLSNASATDGTSVTFIDGAHIKTGTLTADKIDVSNLHVQKVYYNSSDDYVILEGLTSGTYIGYVRLGLLNSSLTTRGLMLNGNIMIFAENALSTDSLRIDVTNKKIFPQSVGQWDIGDGTTYFNRIYSNAFYGRGNNSLVDVYKVNADEFVSSLTVSSSRKGKYAFSNGAYLTTNNSGNRLLFVTGNGDEYDITME